MPRALALVTLSLLVLSACSGDDDVLRDRFEALETRLAGIERRLGPAEKAAGAADALRERLDGIDLRLGSLETRIAQMAAAAVTPPTTGAPQASSRAPGASVGSAAPGSAQPDLPAQAQAARERAQALRALQVEYRRRLDAIRANRQAGASMEELRAQRAEVTAWFREQRRAVILGQAPPGP